MHRWLAVIVVLGMAGGCSPKIQGSNPDQMAASIQPVRERLPEKDRQRFTESLQLIAFRDLDFKDLISAGTDSGQGLIAKVGAKLNGMTGEQVLALGDSI